MRNGSGYCSFLFNNHQLRNTNPQALIDFIQVRRNKTSLIFTYAINGRTFLFSKTKERSRAR